MPLFLPFLECAAVWGGSEEAPLKVTAFAWRRESLLLQNTSATKQSQHMEDLGCYHCISAQKIKGKYNNNSCCLGSGGQRAWHINEEQLILKSS